MSAFRTPGAAHAPRMNHGRWRVSIGLGLPLLVAVPGLWLRLSGVSVPPALAASVFAAAVVGAAFLLTWGTELAEIDIGQGLALALLALIAVLPEYAVDVVFAWLAGQDPDRYAPLALANMTGANRLLIGVGWSVVALAALAALRRAGRDASHDDGTTPAPREAVRVDAVQLHRVQVVELAYLALASAYALTLPLRSTLTIVDAVVLFAIFAAYLWRVKGVEDEPDVGTGAGEAEQSSTDDEDEEESELFGPAAAVAGMRDRSRRLITVGMLTVAAVIILAVAEPFAESLVATGEQLHVSQFLLVQWVAPLASETPEFIAVLLLALKLRSAAALGALISSKINQWTLLVGILPVVFAMSAGSLAGLPIDTVQREELLLTAAQSVFAVSLVVTGRLTRKGAWALLGLFTAQFLAAWTAPADLAGTVRLSIAAVYLVLGVVLLGIRRAHLVRVLRTGLRPSRPVATSSRVEDRPGGKR